MIYGEVGEAENEADRYKSTFKLYRHEEYNKIKSSVIDFGGLDSRSDKVIQVQSDIGSANMPSCGIIGHFKPFDEWKMYRIRNGAEGLFILPSILRAEFCAEWFQYFLSDLPNDKELNLKSNISLDSQIKDWNRNLRWITFGYHHNWNTKVYSLDQKLVTIPQRVKDLCTIVRTFMNLSFEPQAGIVNYYTDKSTLCFHTDHSELNHEAPLLSFSLGSPALFLIGGHHKQDSETPIIPILLRDSDLLIMSGKSRLALHAVARVFPITSQNHNRITRINVNIRQVA